MAPNPHCPLWTLARFAEENSDFGCPSWDILKGPSDRKCWTVTLWKSASFQVPQIGHSKLEELSFENLDHLSLQACLHCRAMHTTGVWFLLHTNVLHTHWTMLVCNKNSLVHFNIKNVLAHVIYKCQLVSNTLVHFRNHTPILHTAAPCRHALCHSFP